MNKQIKELAEQAGLEWVEMMQTWLANDAEIERFAELVRADKRKEWIEMTECEVNEIRKDIFEKYKKALLVTRDVTSENDYSAFNFYRAIQDKLRSKNGI